VACMELWHCVWVRCVRLRSVIGHRVEVWCVCVCVCDFYCNMMAPVNSILVQVWALNRRVSLCVYSPQWVSAAYTAGWVVLIESMLNWWATRYHCGFCEWVREGESGVVG
jgi:hypothetical protein